MYALTEYLPISPSDFLRINNVITFPESLLHRTGYTEWTGFPSGRTSLQWALRAAGVGATEEVILPAYTCWAVRYAVEAVATPVFVDIDRHNYSLDIEAVRASVSDKTGAILGVHMYGKPCDMAALSDIATEYDAVVIEDACQALGTTHLDSVVGQYSDYCVFSFRFYKEITAYHGGLVLGEKPEISTEYGTETFPRLRLAGVYAMDAALRHMPPAFYEPLRRRVLDPVSREASKSTAKPTPQRLTAWQRSVLAAQDDGLAGRVKQRRHNATRYRAGLPDVFEIPPHTDDHAYFRYPVLVPPTWRDTLVRRLRQRGIGCSKMYAYSLPDESGYPTAERAAEGMINLPIHANFNKPDIDHITAIVRDVWDELAR